MSLFSKCDHLTSVREIEPLMLVAGRKYLFIRDIKANEVSPACREATSHKGTAR